MTDAIFNSAARGSSKGLGAHEIDWRNPDDDEILDFISHQYKAGKDRRRPWEAEAMENLAFVGGDQDVKFSPETLDLAREIIDAEVAEEWDQQIEINTLKGFVLQRMALMVGVPITWFVHPWSGDDDDVSSARIGQKLLQHQFAGGDAGFQGRLLEAFWIMFCTGVVFAHSVWDPTRGDQTTYRPPKSNDDQGETKGRNRLQRWSDRIAEKLGKKATDVRLDDDGGYTTSAGDVHVEFATGFELTEPAHCQNVREAGWIIFTKLREIEKLRERYGSVVDQLNPDNTSDAYEAGWAAEYGTFGDYSDEGLPNQAPADHALVHELWRPGSGRYPKGYRGVTSQDIVLDKGHNPYKHGRVPFTAIKELPERRFRPRCTVRMLIKMQTARNVINGKIARHVNKVVDPHILAEQGVRLPDDFLQRGPSKTTEIPDGMIDRIKALDMPTLPTSVLNFDERLRSNMMEVAGIHDSSLGRSESAQQSGRHAAILQQSDARANSVTRMLVEEGLSETGSQCLWLYYQYVTKQRLVVLSGSTYTHEALTFKGQDLYRAGREPGPHTFNVEISIGSEPDVAAVYERIEMLIKAGLLDPVNRESDRLKIEKMIGEVAVRDQDETATHRSNAAREHLQILKGDAPKVARGDSDTIHIDEHERWTTTEEFRRELRKKPYLSQLIELHLRQHLYQLIEKQERPKHIARVVEADMKREYADRMPPEPAAAPPMPGAMPSPGPVVGPGGGGMMNPTGIPAGAESPSLVRFSA